MCFIDDDKNLQNLFINGIKVYSIEDFLSKFRDKFFDQIWFSKKNINNKILKKAKNVYKFNNLIDFIYNSINSKINVLSIADRKSIKFKSNSLSSQKKEVILITGSGGSIGGEIVKQLSKQKFKKIILIDNSEFNLFNLRQSLKNTDKNLDKRYVFKLGSICDKPFLNQIFSNYKIDTIINCAAYKHVDFVEINKIEAFYNNVVGNENLLSLAEKYKPGMARFEGGFFGFSMILINLFFLLNLATPYLCGSLTGYPNIVDPFFKDALFKIFSKFDP